MPFSHIDDTGKAQMVDISHKPKVKRTAWAQAAIRLAPATVSLLRNKMLQKGDALACARIAGIMGGKKTADLIPLCHPIAIDRIDVDFEVGDDCIVIRASAVCVDKTGIEMEALTAVSVAALTIYDMCKAVDKAMTITDIHLVQKTKEPVEQGACLT